MSMIATRVSLDIIGMNGLPGSSNVGNARAGNDALDMEPARKKPRTSMRSASETPAVTRTQDDNSETTNAKNKKRKKNYDEESDGFVFTKSKRTKAAKEPGSLAVEQHESLPSTTSQLPTPDSVDVGTLNVPKKPRRQLPITPDREVISETADFRAAQSQSHANVERVPSPVRPITVEKKRRKQGPFEEEHTARILLPASDTPIIRRNRAMRQSVANNERRRSSSGMRGRRASSRIDEGRWNAQPHSEVQASEFYTIISPDLTEPRRMRLLLGWCGDRALPPKPQAPSSSSKKTSEEFQALQAARIIQEELSKELFSNAALSEWFSRDLEAPQPAIVLRNKPNPRNVANAAKVEELEKELQRLKAERQAWDGLIADATKATDASTINQEQTTSHELTLSPPRIELLSPSQQEIFKQFQQSNSDAVIDLNTLETRLHDVSSGIEFIVDQFSHSVHAVANAKDMAGRMADRSLQDATKALKQRDQELQSRNTAPNVDALDALRGLAKILNARR